MISRIVIMQLLGHGGLKKFFKVVLAFGEEIPFKMHTKGRCGTMGVVYYSVLLGGMQSSGSPGLKTGTFRNQ